MSERKISKRYAEALFTSISDKLNIVKVWEELHHIASLINESKEFESIVKNPAISIDDKTAVFNTLHKQKKLSDILHSFILILIEKQRLILLSQISDEFYKLVLNSENKIEATVIFAEKAKESIKKDIISKLEKLTGKTVILKEEVNPDLIGGVQIRFGSKLYDATIKGQLEKLKASLV